MSIRSILASSKTHRYLALIIRKCGLHGTPPRLQCVDLEGSTGHQHISSGVPQHSLPLTPQPRESLIVPCTRRLGGPPHRPLPQPSPPCPRPAVSLSPKPRRPRRLIKACQESKPALTFRGAMRCYFLSELLRLQSGCPTRSSDG